MKSKIYILLTLILLLALYLPIIFVLLTSFKTEAEINQSPIEWFPSYPTFENYSSILSSKSENNFIPYFFNSFLISVISTFLVVGLSIPAAFSLSQMNYKHTKKVLGLIIFSRILPPISLVVPLFIMFSTLGLLDSLPPLILINIYLNMPFSIWVLKSYFDTIPHDIIELGKIDGLKQVDILSKIVLPYSKPAIVASIILCFIFSWNEFLSPFILSSTTHSITLPVGISDYIGDAYVDWGRMCSAAILCSLPGVLTITLLQKPLIGVLSKASRI